MRRFAGQAARHTGRLVHALVQFAFAIVLTSLALVAVFTWRLSRGPLDMPWLATRLEHAISADSSVHITLGSAALTWEGFASSVDRPLDIRVTDVVATDAAGTRIASIPQAEVSLSTHELLLGRIEPRAIEVDGARLRVEREVDGTVKLDLGTLLDSANTPASAVAETAAPGTATSLLQSLLHPPAKGGGSPASFRWGQLRRVRIRDAVVRVTDRQLGNTWTLAGLGINLERAREGGIAGTANATLQLGGQSATIATTAKIDTATRRTTVAANIGPIVPAALAREVNGAEALAPLDAPVSLSGSVELDPDLVPQQVSAHAEIGAGSLRLANQTTVVLGGAVDAQGTPEHIALRVPQLGIAPRPGGKRTNLQARADLARAADGSIAVTGSLGLDQVAFADLPELWPQGVGGPGSRPWIVENVTDGIARNGHADFGMTVPPDFSNVAVTHLDGGIDGEGVTVNWLRPVPPIEGVAAHLTLEGTDAVLITVTDGRQAGGTQGGLRIKGGRVHLTGFNDKDQFADIDGDLAGPVPDLLSLLRQPRIRLLERSPLPVGDATGQIAGSVTVTRLPLRSALSMDDVDIHATAALTDLHLAAIAAGHDLDHGTLSLQAGREGLHAAGSAVLGGVPADIGLDMDFRAGPPTQVLRRATVAAANVNARQLAGWGLDVGDVVGGTAAVNLALASQRDGTGEATIAADLGKATLAVRPLGYAKPAGRAATLTATLHLDNDRVTAINPLRLTGDGVQANGTAGFAGGKLDLVTLQRVAFGDTDLHGQVRVPQHSYEPWRIDVAGPSLDATSQFARAAPGTPKPEPKQGPPYVADLRFDRVVLGPDRAIRGVAAHVENDGLLIRHLSISGNTVVTGGGGAAQGGGAFQATIEPLAGARHLSVSAADAGGLMRVLDLTGRMQGGRMTLGGSYDDRSSEHPLTGTAIITDFRIHDAPTLAKLLQAMTLYGVLDAMRGSGLGFSKLEAPFRYTVDTLDLSDARAFSSSLGMTAKGHLDLARQTADVSGTIVPAYFFNSLLGDIPLIGRLFSPERGGGVFAATYSLRGPIEDPAVQVNALAALTPGFLRGVFGLMPGRSTSIQPETGREQAR